MASKFFYLREDFLRNRVIQTLDPELYKFWFNLLRLANAHKKRCIPSADNVVTDLGMRRDHVGRFLGELVELGLMIGSDDGSFAPSSECFRFGPRDCSRPPANEWAILRSTVFERDDYTCQYCGKRGHRLECDHIVPVSRGGSHDYDNLATACFKCNRSKSAKTLKEWRR